MKYSIGDLVEYCGPNKKLTRKLRKPLPKGAVGIVMKLFDAGSCATKYGFTLTIYFNVDNSYRIYNPHTAMLQKVKNAI